jgi:hypothetical protein
MELENGPTATSSQRMLPHIAPRSGTNITSQPQELFADSIDYFYVFAGAGDFIVETV